ncbi:MAG: hypothetical protein Q7R30_06030 [Acidobacteriota bacterium]|nr:hypothetical protein [Acidobacteriota bacterium]
MKITVGGQMEEEAARRFVDAWHRAGQGDSFQSRHLAFESSRSTLPSDSTAFMPTSPEPSIARHGH